MNAGPLGGGQNQHEQLLPVSRHAASSHLFSFTRLHVRPKVLASPESRQAALCRGVRNRVRPCPTW
uniref:Uncharacterized protein n=1 Tax=Streptomyces rochei TaxID=1928 RepID=A0A0U3IZB6_STRRO|nr:hypothetical protein [Streptomyces rochei]